MSTAGAQLPDQLPCPNCGTPSSGKFCAECGSALLGATCGACLSLLTPGARFCHQCGAPAGTKRAVATVPVGNTPFAPDVSVAVAGQRSVLPWVVGTAALLALVITVAVQQSSSAPLPIAPSAQTAPGGDPGDAGAAGAAGAAPFAAGGAVRAPDISSLTPRQRADRLYDRVMRQATEGKTDSAAFFASMATQAYEMLGPLDDDLKYDYGRMAEVAGNVDLAQAQADALLKSNPNHLLGLALGARIAQLKNDAAARARYNARLLAAEAAELQKPLDEYVRHRDDIAAAVADARAGTK